MNPQVYVASATVAERRRHARRDALYGARRSSNIVLTNDDILDAWVGEFRARVRADQDACVLNWGPAGSGKSTMGLHLGRHIDPSFNARTLPDRVAFRPEHIPLVYKRTPRYGFAFIDEAASAGLMATDTFSPDQKDLVELVNAIRAKNVVLFVNIPDPSDLAKSFRARRADYRIEVRKEYFDEPPVGYLGRRVRERKFRMDDGKWLGFSDEPEANPLRWPEYRTSEVADERRLWEVYYPMKMRYLDDSVDSIETRMKARAERRRKRDGKG